LRLKLLRWKLFALEAICVGSYLFALEIFAWKPVRWKAICWSSLRAICVDYHFTGGWFFAHMHSFTVLSTSPQRRHPGREGGTAPAGAALLPGAFCLAIR
jgi:hypothetical protein